MELTKFEKYKALMQQAEFNIARFDHRRDYSWKVSIGFWAAILGSAAIIEGSKLAMKEWPLYIGLVVIPGLHAIWLIEVFKANKEDKLWAFGARNSAEKLLNVDIKPPEHRSGKKSYQYWSKKKFYKDWSVQFQWFTTTFLTIALVAFVLFEARAGEDNSNGMIEIIQGSIDWTALATIALVVVTSFIAFVTARAASATKRGVEAQVVVNLLREYAQDDMGNAVAKVRKFGREDDGDIVKAFTTRVKNVELKHSVKRFDKLFELDDLNSSRRKVSHYFQKVHRLHKSGLITKKIVKQILDEEQIKTWRYCVEPLEWLLKYPNQYAREQFDELDELFGVGRRELSGLEGWAD